MERALIQNNTSSIEQIENFVRAVCDDNHIPNYFATISVPVLKAAEYAFHHNANSPLTIFFEQCRGGIRFIVQSDYQCFEKTHSSGIPPTGSDEELLYLVNILSDELEVLDGGCGLQLTFDVLGIAPQEVAHRIHILENFYVNIRSQIVEVVES